MQTEEASRLGYQPDFRCAYKLFFDDMSPYNEELPRCVSRAGEVLDGYGDQLRDPMARRETLELVRSKHNRK